MSMVVNALERKVTRIGRSYGVTFPLDFLKEQGIEPGDVVTISGKGGRVEFVKSRPKVELPEGIDKDFFKLFEETYQEYEEALRGLVHR